MRTLPIAVLLVLALGASARAGVYPTSDPHVLLRAYGGNPEQAVNPRALEQVEATLRFNALPSGANIPPRLFEMRALAKEPEGKLDELSPRALYLRQIAYFEQLSETRPLDPVEAVGLSACYLRLAPPHGALGRDGKPLDVKEYRRKARRVLAASDTRHFLVKAALAAWDQQCGEYGSAISHTRDALAAWPRVWTHWSAEQLAFYRECEQYNLTILESRVAQGRQEASPKDRIVTLDPLFPYVPPAKPRKGSGFGSPTPKEQAAPRPAPLRFVNEEGKYAAGDLAVDEAAKIPPTAGGVVLRLALWHPRDLRLCWLLAELLNAAGQVETAERLLTNLVQGEEVTWPELLAHQAVLDKAVPVMKQLREKATARLGLSAGLTVLAPPGTVGAPLGYLAYYYSAMSVPLVVGPAIDSGKGDGHAPPPQDPQGVLTQIPPAPLNVQHVVVSFVFGVLVAALLGMQWQALRRRRQQPAEPPAPEESPAPPQQPAEPVRVRSEEGIVQQPPS